MKCENCGKQIQSLQIPFISLIDEEVDIRYLKAEDGIMNFGALIDSVGGIIYVDLQVPLSILCEGKNEESIEIFKLYSYGLLNKKDNVGGAGSQFIFIYIESESQYLELLENWGEEIMDCAKKGIQFVSPLVMAQKINLIKLAKKKFQMNK